MLYCILISLSLLVINFQPPARPNLVDGIILPEKIETKATLTPIEPLNAPPKLAVVKTTKPAPKPPTQPVQSSGDMPAIMIRIRGCESGHNYTAQNPTSTASGAYQFIDGTWANFGGYAKAKLAPPAVQDEKAKQVYASSGTRPWVSSIGCWG